MKSSPVKISIIGAGFVGSTTAFTLMNAGLASDIVMVDINKEKSVGEVLDLSHGASFVKPVDIIAGDYKDTLDSDIVIITSGAPQEQGETRLDLIHKNYKIFKDIIPKVAEYSPNSILLVVSNPVDILSYITYKLSGFPKERVIGSGTVLDTSRFKYLLSKKLNIDARNVHSYIMGEHGDSEIATWSLTTVAGMNINEYCKNVCRQCDGLSKYNIHQDVKNAGYEVINRKGATYYAVSLAVKRIVEAIIRDENSILTVSTIIEGEYGIAGIYLGAPAIVGSSGVKKLLEVPLNEEELEKLRKSAETLKKSLSELNFE